MLSLSGRYDFIFTKLNYCVFIKYTKQCMKSFTIVISKKYIQNYPIKQIYNLKSHKNMYVDMYKFAYECANLCMYYCKQITRKREYQKYFLLANRITGAFPFIFLSDKQLSARAGKLGRHRFKFHLQNFLAVRLWEKHQSLLNLIFFPMYKMRKNNLCRQKDYWKVI